MISTFVDASSFILAITSLTDDGKYTTITHDTSNLMD